MPSSTAIGVGGWDNDNFLDSLGSSGGNTNDENVVGTEAIDRANDEYYRQSRYGRPELDDGEQSNADMASVSDAAAEIYAYSYNKNVAAPAVGTNSALPVGNPEANPSGENLSETGGGAATLSKELVDRAKASHYNDKEESSQGGSRFQDLLAKARDQSPQQQRMQNPLLSIPTEDVITPPSSIMTPEEIANLSTEAQAQLYREFFYVQQQNKFQELGAQKPKPIGSTSSNYLQAGIGFDGRKIGRNRDGDALSNASDVYFARLKRDSTTRNLARYSGDHQTANDVFHDPAIQDISAPVNPYLEDQRSRMRDMFETIPEEMLLVPEFNPHQEARTEEENKSYSGVSYKEKIAQKNEERELLKNQQTNNNNNNGNEYSY